MTPEPKFRIRRGKVVQVPPEWVGAVTSRQKINKRPSKAIHKRRKEMKSKFRSNFVRVKREGWTDDP